MKLTTLKFLHSEINREFFAGELSGCPIYRDRSRFNDGHYIADYGITLHRDLCGPILVGTLMHEMVHQWQHEVMGYDLGEMTDAESHGPEFRKVCNALSIRYNIAYNMIFSFGD